MRLLVLCSCALVLSLPGNCQKELKADLLSVPHVAMGKSFVATSLDRRIAADMMSLTERTHEPSAATVDQLAKGLAKWLQVAKARDSQVEEMVAHIDAVFKSAGTSTSGFLDRVARFEAVLGETGVPPARARELAGLLKEVGKQVRGPEDTPVDVPQRRIR